MCSLKRKAKGGYMKTKSIGKIYVLKVALDMKKKVWRRIAIRGSQTLDDLHDAVFKAFDREEEHLYSFFFPQPGSSGRLRDWEGVEYTHPYDCEEHSIISKAMANFFNEPKKHNAAKTRIDSLELQVGWKFRYLFDFGDSWWHDITVEQTDGQVEKGRYPRIIEKHGKSPAQYPDWD